ncbi:YheC/YheD family protein [Desulfitibacter alkalitolerans]|uniref:YheC/YheD family endospore coat-associated protein n=1 Tax=Desulfitibacter alkalitolerans TaxID=264641 RepID=UPI00048272D3|nr:YheC/YheD family protein [Desulfitibacter alkalitolerans]
MNDGYCLSKTYARPIVGILIKDNHAAKLIERQEPLKKHLCLLRANEEAKTTIYFFSINDLHENLVYGIAYNKVLGRWERHKLPYPDVVYKSYGTKKEHKLNNVFLKQLERRDIRTLNYLFTFNKWEVYNYLSQNKSIGPHLPDTIYYSTPDDLKKMLKMYSKVYLKECQSSLGRGVLSISKLPLGGYEIKYYINRLHIIKTDDFNNLVNEVQKFYGKRSFLIQEAIDLVEIDNSIVDMRAELQKNGHGDIVIAALSLRIGNKNAPITTHAASIKFEAFFKSYMKYSDEAVIILKNRISKLLKIIYNCLEQYYGPTGELSIDIGLDKRDHLWFIENNCLSSKVSFYKAYDMNTIHKSYVNLLEYAKFLYKTKLGLRQ